MKIKTLSAAAMLGMTALTMVTPASAALSECTGNNTCIWAYDNFSSYRFGKPEGDPNFQALPSGASNVMDSWNNRSGAYSACASDGSNGSGLRQTFQRASNDNSVSAGLDNIVSGLRTAVSCGG